MITYDQDYIDRLNRQYESGKFLKAVILTEAPGIYKYWIDHETSLEFEGHTYEPLYMKWDNIKTSQGMPTEGAEIVLSNIKGGVTKYIKTLDVTGNVVILQLLHLDLIPNLVNYWKRKFKVLGVRYDQQSAVVTVGRNLGRNRLPRGIILASEYPGISSDLPRIL